MTGTMKFVTAYLVGFLILLFIGAFLVYYFLFTKNGDYLFEADPAGQREFEEMIQFDTDGFPVENTQSDLPQVPRNGSDEELLGVMTEIDTEFGATTPLSGELENIE